MQYVSHLGILAATFKGEIFKRLRAHDLLREMRSGGGEQWVHSFDGIA